MAVVMDRILVDDSVDLVLLEGEVVVRPLFHLPLDCVHILIGAQPVRLVFGRLDATHVDALGVRQRQRVGHSGSVSALGKRLARSSFDRYFFLAGSAVVDVSLSFLFLEDVCIFEPVLSGKAVDADVVLEVIKIFEDAVAPTGLDLSTCSLGEEGAASAFHVFGLEGDPRIHHVHGFD
jgi:hypothetical protein